MKKYPYIGKGLLGSVVLFTDSSFGVAIKHENKSWEGVYRGGWNESIFADITPEHLSNTWGVVESKEHAESIIELAELHGIKVWCADLLSKVDIIGFTFVHGDLMLQTHPFESVISQYNLKKITIPLPPKDKVKKPDFSELQKHFDCRCSKCGGKCCAGFCGDWPQVGDKVLVCNLESDSRLVDFNNEVVDVIAITKGARGLILTISHPLKGIGAVMLTNEHISKPKTKEDLLTEELQTKLCNNSYVDNFTLASDIINGMIPGLSYNSDIESAVKGVINKHLDGDA